MDRPVFLNKDGEPEIPGELWMLQTPENGTWVCSIDDAPFGPTYLVAFTQEDAANAALHQNVTYEIECIPVRVK